MIDPEIIRKSPEVVRANLKKRGMDTKKFDEFTKADDRYRKLVTELQQQRHERNKLTEEVAKLKKEKKSADSTIKKSRTLGEQIQKNEEGVATLEKKRNELLMSLPNILHESVPKGKDSTENVEIRTWGDAVEKNVQSHGEFGEKLGILDFERAAKIAGRGFVFIKGKLALLDLALQRFAIDELVSRGFVLVEPPLMMARGPYEGVTDLKDFENVMYKVEGEDLYLIATSEHPLVAQFSDEVIDESKLPIKLCGLSVCFRKEIGAHGVDTKGLFRMHQFNKVEQVVISRPEDSWSLHEELLANTEQLFQKLGIPHRVVNVCTGDIGTVAAKKYDIEAWFPRQKKYGEVASCSNCTDYQARRLGIKIGKYGGDKRFAHTLNNTGIATSRAMVAILENFQDGDKVSVPEVLHKYTGFEEITL